MKYFLAALFTLGCFFAKAQNMNSYYLLAGTYASGNNEGIQVYKFNAQRGNLSFVRKVAGAANASYMAVSPDMKFVYTVNEYKDRPGEISAFAFDRTKGDLKLLNRQPAGDAPCYISIDSTGKFLIVAEYGSGSISVYKTNADGSLQPRIQHIEHEGYGIVYERQEKPHVHSVVFSPDQKYVFAADLGNDRLYQYRFDPKNTTAPLSPAGTPYYIVPDGSGPRHFTFHPDGKTAYLLNELIGEIIVYRYNGETLEEVQTIASATAGGKYEQGSADIHLSPNAKFLYTSNRGASDNLSIY
ncbi:MAG TPA: lactonase family protein, partial [Chitinophagaceae bacterium]